MAVDDDTARGPRRGPPNGTRVPRNDSVDDSSPSAAATMPPADDDDADESAAIAAPPLTVYSLSLLLSLSQEGPHADAPVLQQSAPIIMSFANGCSASAPKLSMTSVQHS